MGNRAVERLSMACIISHVLWSLAFETGLTVYLFSVGADFLSATTLSLSIGIFSDFRNSTELHYKMCGDFRAISATLSSERASVDQLHETFKVSNSQ